jgi:ABC-type molybdate transport system substrate-binding protein
MTTAWLRVLIVILAVVGFGLPGVFPARGAVAAPAGTCVLYTSESDDDVNLLADDFMRRTPGVTVKIFRAGSGPVEAKIEAERQAGRI